MQNGHPTPPAERVQMLLLAALRKAAGETGEQRLFKSGKLPGLFASRTGLASEAAAEAIRRQYLEIVRTEARGPVGFDWVRLTPAGIDFINRHESPSALLLELKQSIAGTKDGLPGWLADMRAELKAIGDGLHQRIDTFTARLDALSRRVDDALRKVDALGSPVPQAARDLVPWAETALAHLDRRGRLNLPEQCPLPELFQSLPELGLGEFLAGVRRLGDLGLVKLIPVERPADIAEPEYALADGGRLYYHVSRPA